MGCETKISYVSACVSVTSAIIRMSIFEWLARTHDAPAIAEASSVMVDSFILPSSQPDSGQPGDYQSVSNANEADERSERLITRIERRTLISQYGIEITKKGKLTLLALCSLHR